MNTLKILAVASTAFAATFATAPYAQDAGNAAKAAVHQQLAGTSGSTLTREQHFAAARQLEAKAAAANAKVTEHRVMARLGGSPKSDGRSMSNHCEHLIAQYRANADSYTAQAVEHKRLATAK